LFQFLLVINAIMNSFVVLCIDFYLAIIRS
jgi:hypothetical protein